MQSRSTLIAPCRLVELTSKGFRPTVSNFNVLLKNCMIARDISRAESVMQQISDSGLQVCACPSMVDTPAMPVLTEMCTSMPLNKAAICGPSGCATAASVQVSP